MPSLDDGLDLVRRCRGCGRSIKTTVAHAACPKCGTPYGRLEFGMDVDPAVVHQMERDRQRDKDASYRAFLDEARREQQPQWEPIEDE